MTLVTPGVLAVAFVLFGCLFRHEALPERRRYVRQIIAISTVLLISAVVRALATGGRTDCGLQWPPSVHAAKK
jgi:hypothetical protein